MHTKYGPNFNVFRAGIGRKKLRHACKYQCHLTHTKYKYRKEPLRVKKLKLNIWVPHEPAIVYVFV